MKRRLLLRVLGLGASVLIAAFARPQSMNEADFVVTAKDVFMLGPIQPVAGGFCEEPKWSGDGRFLLVQRTLINLRAALATGAQGNTAPPDTVREILVWRRGTDSPKRILTTPIAKGFNSAKWIPKSTALLLTTFAPEGPVALAFYDAVSESTLTVPLAPDAETRIAVSPATPYLLLSRLLKNVDAGKPATKWSHQVLDPRGNLVRNVPLPNGTDVGPHMLEWTPDGTGLMLLELTAAGALGDTVPCFMLSSGAWQRIRRPNPEPLEKPSGGLLVLRPAAGQLADPALKAPVSAGLLAPRAALARDDFKLESGEKVAVVSSDFSSGSVAPDDGMVAFVSRGGLMVREIIKVDRKVYEAARDAAERAVAISNAKQAALALIMNAADNDDVLPPNTPEWRDKVFPYIKSRGILDSFTYTFRGGSMTELEEPTKTEIGYVQGPGGRAVAYADGHVKWVPDPPR